MISEAVDELARRPAEPAGVMAADGRGQVAVVDEPRRRVKQCDQQAPVLCLQCRKEVRIASVGDASSR